MQEIREATDYRIPIQLKLGAARVYDDVRMAAKCGPDIIYLDGAEGDGQSPHIATEETGIPLMAAIPDGVRSRTSGSPTRSTSSSRAGSATARTSRSASRSARRQSRSATPR